jgi:hypothetical protein
MKPETNSGEVPIVDMTLDDITEVVAGDGYFMNHLEIDWDDDGESGHSFLPHPTFLDPRNIMVEAGATELFFSSYNTPEALKYRQRALVGIQAANDARFSDLLARAARFTGDEIDAYLIGCEFASIAKEGHKALKRLADIAKEGGQRAGERAGEDSHSGQILRELCLFLKNHGTLPTKLELRKNSGLDDGKNEVEIYRKEAGKLGLAQLPESRLAPPEK